MRRTGYAYVPLVVKGNSHVPVLPLYAYRYLPVLGVELLQRLSLTFRGRGRNVLLALDLRYQSSARCRLQRIVFLDVSYLDINISDIVVERRICLAFSSLVTADTAQLYVYLLL